MWIIKAEDLSTQRDRLLSNFLDEDDEFVLKNYLKMEDYKWTSTDEIIEAKIWSTKDSANKFLESVRSKVGILKSMPGGWSSTDEFFIDKKLTIQELSYQEWNDLIDINNW
jgi:hypothetical protein